MPSPFFRFLTSGPVLDAATLRHAHTTFAEMLDKATADMADDTQDGNVKADPAFGLWDVEEIRASLFHPGIDAIVRAAFPAGVRYVPDHPFHTPENMEAGIHKARNGEPFPIAVQDGYGAFLHDLPVLLRWRALHEAAHALTGLPAFDLFGELTLAAALARFLEPRFRDVVAISLPCDLACTVWHFHTTGAFPHANNGLQRTPDYTRTTFHDLFLCLLYGHTIPDAMHRMANDATAVLASVTRRYDKR